MELDLLLILLGVTLHQLGKMSLELITTQAVVVVAVIQVIAVLDLADLAAEARVDLARLELLAVQIQAAAVEVLVLR